MLQKLYQWLINIVQTLSLQSNKSMQFKSSYGEIYRTLTVLPDEPKEDWKTLVLETTKPSTLGKNIAWLLFCRFETCGKLHLDNGLGELRTWRSWGLWKTLLEINQAGCLALCLKCYVLNPNALSNNYHVYIKHEDKKTIINLKPQWTRWAEDLGKLRSLKGTLEDQSS